MEILGKSHLQFGFEVASLHLGTIQWAIWRTFKWNK